MAYSLLTNEQKAYVDDLFAVPFETFKRPIKIVTQGSTMIVSTNPNYDPNFKSKRGGPTTTAAEEHIFDAVVDYSATETDQALLPDPNIKANTPNNLVRISVGKEARDLIKKYKEIQFDGHAYEVKGGDMPRGMFAVFNYYDFWLARKD